MKFHHLNALLIVSALSVPMMLLGADTRPNPSGEGLTRIQNPLGDGNDNLFEFINTIIEALLQLGAVVAVIMIILSGFYFVTAQGDEGKIKTAKQILLYTAIGIAILFGARIISEVIVNTVTNVNNTAK